MEIAFPYFFFLFFYLFLASRILDTFFLYRWILFLLFSIWKGIRFFFFFFYELPSGEYREISERRGYTYTSEIYVGTWKNFGIIILVVINKYKLNRMIMFHSLEMDV